MKTQIAVLILSIGLNLATPNVLESRIIGGSLTTIEKYPQMVALLVTFNLNDFVQNCGGSILNQRNILTASHCFIWYDTPGRWRIRVGSTFAHRGGTVHNLAEIILHPNWNLATFNNDIAILRTSNFITYNEFVQPGLIASSNYNVGDNQVVWATGWGITEYGSQSEQLRDVQIWTVNQSTCNEHYRGIITENMLCSGWLGVGGRDQCTGDSGGPLFHYGVIVGICSFGTSPCGSAIVPGVNARVSQYTSWIVENAV